MSELSWKGNAKEMFDQILDNSPKMFRPITRAKLEARLREGAKTTGAVTEELFEEVVREVTPRPFVARALEVIAPLKS